MKDMIKIRDNTDQVEKGRKDDEEEGHRLLVIRKTSNQRQYTVIRMESFYFQIRRVREGASLLFSMSS